MKRKFFFLILLFEVLTSKITHAQNNFYPVLSMEMKIQGMDTLSGGVLDISDTTSMTATMKISLFDTTNVLKLHIKMGKTNSYELYQQAIDFSTLGTARNGFDVSINLGTYLGLLNYFSELSIERNDHSFSTPVTYNR